MERQKPKGEDPGVVRIVRTGSADEFAALVERHRHELRIHCYRMLGNFDEAEDLVQETMVRAWRSRGGFQGRSTFRAWLYRIATNICLDTIKRARRRVSTTDVSQFDDSPPSHDDVPWLQPFPDALLDRDPDIDPEAVVVAKETIELAFLAAVQHLPPRQRAVLILRDVLDWTPSETAEALDGTVAAVNSALQRARATMQQFGQSGRLDWSPVSTPTEEERLLLQQYMDAHARADADAIFELLGEDIRLSMPPRELSYRGRAQVAAFFAELFSDEGPGDWWLVPTRANGQPAAANYVRPRREHKYRATTLDVLRIENGLIVEITTFDGDRFAVFGLPEVIPNPRQA